MTLRHIPTIAEQDYWGPLGMAHCVWLLTFEHPSDLPLVYEWFGLYWDCVTRLHNQSMNTILSVKGLFNRHHAFEPSTSCDHDAYCCSPFP